MNHANKFTTNAHAAQSLLKARLMEHPTVTQKDRVKAMLKRRGMIE